MSERPVDPEMDVEIEHLVIEVPEGEAMSRDELDRIAQRAIAEYASRLMRED
jgi:hypothetical protein